MRFALKVTLALILGLSIIEGFVGAESKPPGEGGTLPGFVLKVPENSELQQYLGVTGKETFTIPEIKAEVVIIEIFSMY